MSGSGAVRNAARATIATSMPRAPPWMRECERLPPVVTTGSCAWMREVHASMSSSSSSRGSQRKREAGTASKPVWTRQTCGSSVVKRYTAGLPMPDSPALVLVDASSYLYRAFHALPALSSSRGEPTGAVLGVLNMLAKFLKECRPKRIALVFDAPGRTFRDDLFAEYKAHRTPMSDDLRAQVEPLLAILRAQGLPLLRIQGVEADDVIGTLACRAARAGQTVLISTGDKDMAQLVDESITLVNTMSNTVLDRAGVKAKFDVFPEQIIDYLALVGDTSDNIPGIEKVGPKTAAKLLNQYQSLDNLIRNVQEVSGKVGENLRAGLETLDLSRKLATIHSDLELAITLEELVPGQPDTERLRELYTRYELSNYLRQLDGGSGEAAAGASAERPGTLAGGNV